MALFQNYPYTDMQTLNLDGVLRQVKTNTENIESNTQDLTEETAARVAADNAEQAARIAAVQNLQDQIDVLSPEEVQKYVAVNKRGLAGTVLLIGDSYLAGWTPDGDVTDWGTYLAQMLGKSIDQNLFKYALGGAGFLNTISGRNFRSLLTEASQAPAIENDAVTYIIVAGGWNDRGFTGQDIAAEVTRFMADAQTLFRNAIVYVANVGYGAGANYSAYMKANVSDGYGRKNGLGDLWTVLATYGAQFLASDNVHPNAAGHEAIARAIYSKLFTGDYKGDNYGPTNVAAGQTNLTLNTTIRNHTLYVTSFAGGSGQTVALSGLTGQANGSTKILSVTGFPFSAANYQQFTVPALFYVGSAYRVGSVIIRFNGNAADIYPLCLNATGNNWQALSGVSEMMLQPFTISAPLALI